MTEIIHPNLSVLMKLDLQDLDACHHIFSENFTWRYFNSKLPELEGDYYGIQGLKDFFVKLKERSNDSFTVQVVDTHPIGDELITTQVCDQMNLDGDNMEIDAVVIWRIVNDKIAEAWDIPAINTVRTIQG